MMTTTTQPIRYEGGCHRGAIRFQVRVDSCQAIDGNHSICREKGFLHLIVPAEKFTLLSGEEVLSTDTFNTRTARHHFYRVCGIHPFYRPRSHRDSIAVNVRCLDGARITNFAIEFFDGANWEENIDRVRLIDGEPEEL
jgi:hypothetical protein